MTETNPGIDVGQADLALALNAGPTRNYNNDPERHHRPDPETRRPAHYPGRARTHRRLRAPLGRSPSRRRTTR